MPLYARPRILPDIFQRILARCKNHSHIARISIYTYLGIQRFRVSASVGPQRDRCVAASIFPRTSVLPLQPNCALSDFAFGTLPFRAMNRSNQTMKPTAPLRSEFSMFAATPWISSRCPASLVRFKSSRSRTRRKVVQRLPWLISLTL